MANGDSTSGIDIDQALRMQRLLAQMPNVVQGQDPTVAPSPGYAPPAAEALGQTVGLPQSTVDPATQQDPSLWQGPTYFPQQASVQPQPQQPVQPPPAAAPNYTPTGPNYTPIPPQTAAQYQPNNLNQIPSDLQKAGQRVTDVMASQPDINKAKVSKLRAALLMPLEILAGAGGQDVSKEYAGLIRPGYTSAMREYQRQLALAQANLGNVKDLTKAQLDVAKQQEEIKKDAEEAEYHKAETQAKILESQQKVQELEVRKSEMQPLNQALDAMRQADPNKQLTPAQIYDATQKYYDAQEHARIEEEKEKSKAAQAQKELEDKTRRGEANVNQNIVKEQNRLNDIIKPLANSRQNIANLRGALAAGDTSGFARYMSIIMADNALASATHGSVRQNIGVLDHLIKSPGLWEYLKGKAQGILQPGKGDISDAVMKQASAVIDLIDQQAEEGEKAQVKNLTDLNSIDPTDPDARDRVNAIINRQYDVPKPTPLPKPKPDSDDDTSKKLADLKKQMDAVDAAIKAKQAAAGK